MTETLPPPAEGRPPVGGRHRWLMIALTAFEIGASILVVVAVKRLGGSDFAAYLWSLIPPLLGGAFYWWKTRDVSGASLALLAFNVLSAVVALVGSHDSKVLLYKDSFVSAIIGLIFLASLAFARPLSFHFGQRFMAGDTPRGVEWWHSRWAHSPFRRLHRAVTVLWGVLLVAESIVKAAVIQRNSFETAYVSTQLLPVAANLLGIAATVVIVRRIRAL